MLVISYNILFLILSTRSLSPCDHSTDGPSTNQRLQRSSCVHRRTLRMLLQYVFACMDSHFVEQKLISKMMMCILLMNVFLFFIYFSSKIAVVNIMKLLSDYLEVIEKFNLCFY